MYAVTFLVLMQILCLFTMKIKWKLVDFEGSVELEAKQWVQLWRIKGGAGDQRGLEQKKRRRWGGLGEEEDKSALPLSQPDGEKKSDEREGRRRRRGRSKIAGETVSVCARAKWGLYKWKQMPGIMNLSGRRWGWRWWSTWLPGWLSLTLLLPLSCLPHECKREKQKETARISTEWKK